MRRICTLLATVAIILSTQLAWGQTRYLDQVFDSVTVKTDETYGVNISIFPIVAGQSETPLPVELKMDVYEPAGDTVTDRPLLLFAITGTFFPAIVNGGFTGERNDYFNVRFATEMAKKGYVVAVVQYRRGWNAVGSVIEQQSTILQAAYRGIQDMRTCVRFFRMTADAMGNPYGIDPENIALGGNGTGNYISYGATYFTRYSQVLLPKFIDFSDPDNPVPFVIEQVHGDPDGVDSALLNLPNWTTYNSDFKVGFGLGGALGDQSWVDSAALDNSAVPFIAMHSYKNPLAPPRIDDVLAVNPDTGEPFAVIPTAAGGYGVVGRAAELGLQTVFDSVEWQSPPFSEMQAAVSARAELIDEGATGLYPFITPFTPGDAECLGTGVPGDTLTEWVDPYGYFDPAIAEATWNFVFQEAIAAGQQITGAQAVCRNERGSPNTIESANLYIDTVLAFMAPRLGVAMDLFETVTVSNKKFVNDANISVYPNPADNRLYIDYKGGSKMIREVSLMDYTGRIISNYTNINRPQFDLRRENLPTGMYLVKIKVDDQYTMKRVMFK